MYEDLCLYINGQFLKGGGRREQDVFNPATDEVIGKLPHAGHADLDLALESAQKAFRSWKKSSPLERSKILRKVAELARARSKEIGANITLDMGKPVAEAVGEVNVCAEHAEWAAEECRRIYGRVIPSRSEGVRQFVLKEPIGVVAAFSPWNFPFNQAIRKIVSALGAGCTIIIKGPEDAPSAVVAIARAGGSRRPTLLVLDDVDRAPADVHTALRELGRALAALPVLALAAGGLLDVDRRAGRRLGRVLLDELAVGRQVEGLLVRGRVARVVAGRQADRVGGVAR